MEQRVSVVTLGVADLDRARRFYETLGWSSPSTPEDGVVFFQSGGMVLALWNRALLAEDSVRDGHRWLGRCDDGPQRRLTRTGRRGARRSGGRGGDDRPTGRVHLPGGYSGVFIDPDGHPWEVAHNPFWQMDEPGAITI